MPTRAAQELPRLNPEPNRNLDHMAELIQVQKNQVHTCVQQAVKGLAGLFHVNAAPIADQLYSQGFRLRSREDELKKLPTDDFMQISVNSALRKAMNPCDLASLDVDMDKVVSHIIDGLTKIKCVPLGQ